MPVDADAYMAGAIPTLSRGGSWVQEHQLGGSNLPPSQLQSGSAYGPVPRTVYGARNSLAPGSSAYDGQPLLVRSLHRAASTAGSSASPAFGGRSGASMIDGQRREQVLGPIQTSGWLKAGSEAGNNSTIPSSSFDEYSLSDQHSVALLSSVPHSTQWDRGRQSSKYHFDEHLPPNMGDSWEKQGGSPKRLSPESDYGLRRDVYAKVDGRLKKVSLDAVSPAASPYRKLSDHQVAPSLSADDDDHTPNTFGQRRHPQPPPIISLKPKKKFDPMIDLSRSAQLNCRLARLSLQGRGCRTPDPEPSAAFNGHSASPQGHQSPQRPNVGRRHTSLVGSDTSGSSHAPSSLHFVEPVNKPIHQMSRQRHSSTPHGSSSIVTSYDGLSQDSSTFDFTSPTPSPSRAKGTVSKPFPRPKTGSPYHNVAASLRSASSSGPSSNAVGYVSPLTDDVYDRYTSHPASPLPYHVEKVISPTPPTSTSTSELMRPPQPSGCKDGKYIPLGYAKPVKDFPWNRDGPAMKTHGIAWNREGEADRLPIGPEGPRWTVARPPRGEHVLGGRWWESGGDGGSSRA